MRESRAKKELQEQFTSFKLSWPGDSLMVLDPWGLLGYGEADNSEKALEAPFDAIGPKPMEWFVSDILKRNVEDKRSYPVESLRRIVATFKASKHEDEWFHMGRVDDSRSHHPYHPNQWAHRELMPWNLEPISFDVDDYLDKLSQR